MVDRRRRWPWLCLAALGSLLLLTAVPAPFTIDDNHHAIAAVAMREGRLTVPGTEDLPPSRELLFFDPLGFSRQVERTPVAPTVPPLYAAFARPFVTFGWRGLVALNVLALLAAAVLVRRLATTGGLQAKDGWAAAAVFLAGSYVIEYAQGVWAHCLALALTTAGAVLVAALVEGRAATPLRHAWAAGLLLGLAAGVRYQDVVVAAALGIGVLLWATPRLRATLAYGAGLALPLAASSGLNFLRHGSWNPISKGGRYLAPTSGGEVGHPLVDMVRTAWFMVVDHATRPPLKAPLQRGWWTQDVESGVILVGGAVKKALLQSSPWVILALAVLATAWLRRPPAGGPVRTLRLISLVAAMVLGSFAAAGSRRTDGLCFNQRYLLELMPLLAVAFVWSLSGLRAGRRAWAYGALAGALAAEALLAAAPAGSARLLALRWLPLALAAALLLAWIAWRRAPAAWASRGQRRATAAARAVATLAGASLGWSLLVHLGEDLVTSREYRRTNLERSETLAAATPPRAALFAYWWYSDAAGPLYLDRSRDLVTLDVARDVGEAAQRTIAAAVAQGRPVLLFGRFPPELEERVTSGWRWRQLPTDGYESLHLLVGPAGP